MKKIFVKFLVASPKMSDLRSCSVLYFLKQKGWLHPYEFSCGITEIKQTEWPVIGASMC